MILFLDTETTGLYPGSICQLSYVMAEKNKTVAKNMFFKVDHVEEGAFAVHGFSVEKLLTLSGGKTFKDRFDEIEKDFSTADLVVAHNASFDFMFLKSEFEKCGAEFLPKNAFCSMKGMMSVIKLFRANGRGYKYPKLSELCAYFNLSENEIASASKKLFGNDSSFHDARFDTTALFLSMVCGMEKNKELQALKDYI